MWMDTIGKAFRKGIVNRVGTTYFCSMMSGASAGRFGDWKSAWWKSETIHMPMGWCSLLAKVSAGISAGTSRAGFFILGLLHSLLAECQEQASQKNQEEAVNLLRTCLGST